MGETIDSFTGGCAAGVCSIKNNVKIEAWKPN